MRLTLRTLLAHLAGHLDPSSDEDIASRVRHNPAATALATRIQGLVNAPAIREPSEQLEACEVAQYLDNELAPDRVMAVESACLADDSVLDEIVACHQILSEVVHGQVSVPAALRQQLQTRCVALSAGPTTDGSDGPSAEPAETLGARQATGWYARPAWRFVAAATGAAALVVLVYASFAARSPETGPPVLAEQPLDMAPAPAVTERRATPVSSLQVLNASHAEPEREDFSTVETPAGPMPERLAGVPRPESNAARAKAGPRTRGATSGPRSPSSDGVASVSDAVPGPSGLAALPPVSHGSAAPREQPRAPSPRVPVGRCGTDRDAVPLRYDAEARIWGVCRSGETLYSGDVLLTLPAWQTRVALQKGPAIASNHFARFSPLVPGDDGTPGLRPEYGQLEIDSSRAGRIRISSGEHDFELRFSRSRTRIELLAFPASVSGQPHWRADGVVLQGSMLIAAAGTETPLQAGERFRLEKGQVTQLGEDDTTAGIPDPSRTPYVGEDSLAARPEILEATGLVEQLQAVAANDSDQARFASLLLAHLGYPVSAVSGLDSERHEMYWHDYLAALRAGHADPQVRDAFEVCFGSSGAELYQQLYFNRGQMSSTDVERQVQFLKHQMLARRVLAFDQLRLLTGKTLLYRPTLPEEQRRRRVESWERAWQDGELDWQRQSRNLE